VNAGRRRPEVIREACIHIGRSVTSRQAALPGPLTDVSGVLREESAANRTGHFSGTGVIRQVDRLSSDFR
jgi:hypothetical protein